MKKANIQKFIAVFQELDPSDQLLLADAIVEELHKSDRLIEQDGFNRDLCGMVMPELEKFVSITRDKIELEKAKNLLERFDKLPKEYQEKVMGSFLTSSVKDEMEIAFEVYLIQQEYNYGRTICKKEGHIPSEWIQAPGQQLWRKKCLRCNEIVDGTDKKPKTFTKK